MCPRKQTTEPNLVILVSFFSGEVTSYTDTMIASTYCGKYAVPGFFFLGHPVYSCRLPENHCKQWWFRPSPWFLQEYGHLKNSSLPPRLVSLRTKLNILYARRVLMSTEVELSEQNNMFF